LNKSKPSATKGIFLKKVSVSSTMGVGVKVDPSTLYRWDCARPRQAWPPP
jgi:hypothetical protein